MVRLKNRYLLVNILYPESSPATNAASTRGANAAPDVVQFHKPTSDALTIPMLLRMIRDSIADLFGDYGSGMASASLQIKYFSPATSTAIIRATRAHYRLVWAALTYITHLPRHIDQPCVFQVVRVSGTIRKSQEEAVRRAKASILQAHRAAAAGKEGADAGLLERLMGGAEAGKGGSAGKNVLLGIEDEDDEDEEEEDEDGMELG